MLGVVVARCVVVLSLAFSLAGVSSSALAQDADRMNAYANLVRAEAEYMRVLVEARIADSQIQLNQAQAAANWALAALLQQRVQVLQYEFDRIRRADADVERKVEEIEDFTACIAPINIGETNNEIIHGCLLAFLQRYVSPAIVAEVMRPELGVLPALANFRALDQWTPLEDFPGGNVGQLTDFIAERNYTLRRWSPAHFRLLDMLSSVAAHAEQKVAQYQAYVAGIRSGSANIWTLPDVQNN